MAQILLPPCEDTRFGMSETSQDAHQPKVARSNEESPSVSEDEGANFCEIDDCDEPIAECKCENGYAKVCVYHVDDPSVEKASRRCPECTERLFTCDVCGTTKTYTDEKPKHEFRFIRKVQDDQGEEVKGKRKTVDKVICHKCYKDC